jgi:hypothetical protein
MYTVGFIVHHLVAEVCCRDAETQVWFLPMLTPMTFTERLQFAGGQLIGAGFMFWIGWELLYVIGRKSPARRKHGKYVLGWMFAGFLIGAGYMVSIVQYVSTSPNKADLGLAIIGMLIGWPIGMIHGWIALMLNLVKIEETNTSA